jgi:hypothetical protein
VSSIFKKKRAQAAIELLTTYGWAIIGVLLVIGALAYFDVFDAKRFVSERCDTGAQIQCTGVYANDEGRVELELKNNYLVDIDIEAITIDNHVLVNVGTYDEYTSLEPGNRTRFYIDSGMGALRRGTKQELTAIITFRRHVSANVPGACGGGSEATCYNITGNIVVKVQDAGEVPSPSN